MIQVGDNFDHKSKKPLDARTSYNTLALMKAVTDANINEGCLAYCAETDKYYKFLSTNTVDADTGKWREFSSGGGGTTDYSDLTNKPSIEGVTLTGNKTASDLGLAKKTELTGCYRTSDTFSNDIYDTCMFPFKNSSDTKYNTKWSDIKSKLKSYFDTLYSTVKTRGTATSGGTTLSLVNTGDMYTWNNKQNAITAGSNLEFDGNTLNASMPVLGTIDRSMIFDTTEKVVGKWTDGRPVYMKVITDTMPTTSTDGTEIEKQIAVGTTVDSYIMSFMYIKHTNGVFLPLYITTSNYNQRARYSLNTNSASNKNVISLRNAATAWNSLPVVAIIYYTKTTDAANSYNYASENDYSTSEKIIGTWIDGKPIYQKTIQTTLPTTSTDGTEAVNYISLNTTISEFISIKAIGMNSDKSMFFDCSSWGSVTSSVLSAHISGLTNSFSSNKNTIRLQNYKVSWNGFPVYITIQYTKTS